ncbi:MAG: ribonuclease P protein component [Candidatus Paceibacterota bacterium]
MSFKYTKVAGGEPRISFIVPKSTAKLAVKRNALRRLGYLALSKQEKKLPKGLTGAFVFKKYQDNNETLKNEIETILSKIN